MEDLSGKQLGQYRVIAPLGEGGMAAVYQAYQARVDRYVALKVLPRHYAADPTFAGRFAQEARVIANLEHPNILPVHDYGEHDGYTYLVMRYVRGGTLADLVGGGPVDLSQALPILSQIASALDYAHSRGVVHRDIKPSNVLIDEQGNSFLTDFGIARMLEAATRFTVTGGFVGTPTYASPEQCLGRELDGRSDVYSLGVILYEMATGRRPFDAETPMAVAIKQIHDPLPLPSKVNPAVPDGTERVILKALAKEPRDRYATAGEMVDALARAIAQSLASAAQAPLPDASLVSHREKTLLYGAAPGEEGGAPPRPPVAASAAREEAASGVRPSSGRRPPARRDANGRPPPASGGSPAAHVDQPGERPARSKRSARKPGVPVWAWLVIAVAAVGLVAISAYAVPALWRTREAAPVSQTASPRPSAEPTALVPTDRPLQNGLGAEQRPIVLASFVRPDQPDSAPAIEHVTVMLGDLSGLSFRALVVPDSRAVRGLLESGEAHAGWLNALDYIIASEYLGVRANLVAVRFGSTHYQWQIIARADTGIAEIPQLRGRVMCSTRQGGIDGPLVARLLLLAQGVEPDRDLGAVAEVDDLRQVLLAVYHGECDAGATFHDARATIEEEYPDVWERVIVIVTTPEIPRESLAFVEGVPPDLRARVVEALFALSESPEGHEALAEAYGLDALEPIDEAAYGPLRELLDAANVSPAELDK